MGFPDRQHLRAAEVRRAAQFPGAHSTIAAALRNTPYVFSELRLVGPQAAGPEWRADAAEPRLHLFTLAEP